MLTDFDRQAILNFKIKLIFDLKFQFLKLTPLRPGEENVLQKTDPARSFYRTVFGKR